MTKDKLLTQSLEMSPESFNALDRDVKFEIASKIFDEYIQKVAIPEGHFDISEMFLRDVWPKRELDEEEFNLFLQVLDSPYFGIFSMRNTTSGYSYRRKRTKDSQT